MNINGFSYTVECGRLGNQVTENWLNCGQCRFQLTPTGCNIILSAGDMDDRNSVYY